MYSNNNFYNLFTQTPYHTSLLVAVAHTTLRSLLEYGLFDWYLRVYFPSDFLPFFAVFCSQRRFHFEIIAAVHPHISALVLREWRPLGHAIAVRITETTNSR